MVISKSAIEAFLNRELCNSEKAKLFSNDALDRKLSNLEPPPVFITPPWKQQKVCFLLDALYPGYLNLLDMGGGKSKLVMDVFRWRRARKEVRRMLVLVPGSANVGQWVDEGRIHAPDIPIAGVDQLTREERVASLESSTGNDITVITYAGWLSLTCKGKVITDKQGKPKLDEDGEEIVKGWAIDEKVTKQRIKLFDMVAFDECDVFSNPESLMFRSALRIKKYIKYRYGLTGTPFGKRPEELWGQFYIMDDGETLGPTLGLFRAAFCKAIDDYWSAWPKYEFDEKNKEKFYEVIRHRSIRYSDDEFEGLPKKVSTTVPIIFSKETWAYYDKLREELKASQGNFRLTTNAFMQMRQLCSGYLGVRDPEGDKIQVKFKKNPKLEAMLERLSRMRPDRKAIIWHEYIATGDLICEALEKKKIKFTRLYSKTKHKSDVVRKFKTDPRYTVMVSSSAGARGGNWQVANYNHFYETPTSPKTRKQEEKRTHRGGQKLTVFNYDYVVVNSIDKKILKSLKKGIDLFDAIVDGKEAAV